MSGQSAHLSLKEAKAMQERIQCHGSHASNSGKKSSGKMHGAMKHEEMKKEK